MIYFAYRSAMLPSQRHIKVFDADNVLDFFVKNWQALTDEDSAKALLGIDVYGFPVSDYESDEPVAAPQDFNELKWVIEQYVYCNEVLGDNHCLQVLTDDDEIELAWYVFSDDYKNANMDKVALWFYDELPTALPAGTTDTNSQLPNNLDKIAIGQDSDKCTFLLACTIYDSGNFESIVCKELTGVHLSELPKALSVLPDLSPKDNGYYDNGTDVVQALQYFAKQGVDDIFTEFARYRLEEWQGNTGEMSEGHAVHRDTHCMEIWVNSFYDYCNYYVLFDDVWARAYPDLAKSLLRFGTTWEI